MRFLRGSVLSLVAATNSNAVKRGMVDPVRANAEAAARGGGALLWRVFWKRTEAPVWGRRDSKASGTSE